MMRALALGFVLVSACTAVSSGGPPDLDADTPDTAVPPPPPPPPSCGAAPGGGSAMVSIPMQLRTLSDEGEEAWLGAPAVVDLDRDGMNEIVAARGNRVVVWGADGRVRWGAVPGAGRVWAPPVIGDFTADNGLEVAAAAGNQVTLYTAAGRAITGFPARWQEEIRSIAGGDLDGDGRPEVVIAATERLERNGRRDLVHAFRANGSAVPGFPPNTTGAGMCDDACDVTGGFDQNLAVGFIDNDRRADIFAPMDNAYMSWHRGTGEAFPAAAGVFEGVTRVPGVRFFADFADARRGYAMNEDTAEQAHFTNTAPAIADLDGDGTRELIALGSIQNAAQSNRRLGVGLFVVRPDGTRPAAWMSPFRVPRYLAGLEDFGGSNVVAATNQVTVADLDPSSRGLEIVFAGFDGQIYCVGADRSMRWTFRYTMANNQVTGGAVVADLSGDGRPEVIFASYSTAQNTSNLFILDASGREQRRVMLPGRGAMPVPAVGDTNGDGTLEIVVSLKDPSGGAELLVYTVPGSAPNCLPWPMGRLNPLRNGFVGG